MPSETYQESWFLNSSPYYTVPQGSHQPQEASLLTLKQIYMWDSPGGSVVKNLPAGAGDKGSILGLGSILGWGRFPWRRKWQPTPVFLSGKSHGQRSLVCYSSWSHKSPTRLTQQTNAIKHSIPPHPTAPQPPLSGYLWLVPSTLQTQSISITL